MRHYLLPSLKDWLAQQVVTMNDAPSGDHRAQQSVEHCLPKAVLECIFHLSNHPEIPAHLAIDLWHEQGSTQLFFSLLPVATLDANKPQAVLALLLTFLCVIQFLCRISYGRQNECVHCLYRVYAIAPKQCCDRQVATGQLSEFSICWDAYRPEWRARPLKLVAEMIKAKQKHPKATSKSRHLVAAATDESASPLLRHSAVNLTSGQQKNKNQCR